MGMAKRKFSKKGMKTEPSVMTLAFNLPINSGPAVNTIDLSQCASIVNRRFYRQGINWAVAGFKVLSSSTTTGSITVKKLPNTWITGNAWEKAFRAWNRQQMDALEESGGLSAAAKFRDFKVYADVEHVNAGFGANLLPVATSSDGIPTTFLPGEWEPSQIVIPNAGAPGVNDERFLHMVGVNFNNPTLSRGVLEGYADSRAYPQSPDPVSPNIDSTNNWLSQMFDVGDNMGDIVDNATDKNDNLPYDQVNYPGGEGNAPELQIHDTEFITGTTIGGVSRFKGGNFPCGLIRLATNTNESGFLTVLIDLVPGPHRGYLCEPMTEM